MSPFLQYTRQSFIKKNFLFLIFLLIQLIIYLEDYAHFLIIMFFGNPVAPIHLIHVTL